jgi:PadR family transcriptional regulator, regulatory protein PadR
MNTDGSALTDPAAAIERLSLELRRGVIVLAALSQLDEPGYGYALQQRLAARGMEIEQGTLYPLLRRLQEQGLLEEEWVVEGSRPRKYYRLAAAGHHARDVLQAQWEEITAVLGALLARPGGEG